MLGLGEGGDEADGGGLAGAGGADEGGDGAGLSDEGKILEDRFSFFIGEIDTLEFNASIDGRHDNRARGVVVFAEFGEDFAGALKAGEGFRELGATLTMPKIGATRKARKAVKVMNSPRVR